MKSSSLIILVAILLFACMEDESLEDPIACPAIFVPESFELYIQKSDSNLISETGPFYLDSLNISNEADTVLIEETENSLGISIYYSNIFVPIPYYLYLNSKDQDTIIFYTRTDTIDIPAECGTDLNSQALDSISYNGISYTISNAAVVIEK